MSPELSIIFPCRNEEQALPLCLRKTKRVLEENGIDAEIIVSDSSTDNSPRITLQEGAKLVKHDKRGYGRAYLEGIKEAKGKYILMVDADCTYDLEDIPKFLHYLREGYDMIIGNRFGKQMQQGAMPWTHKYIGNPILSATLRLFFNASIKDAHCGIRAIRRDALDSLNLSTTGMEFASEMIIKATRRKLRIAQFPVKYYRRVGVSKLETTKDGWRHLRFMLLYSPMFLFLIPGMTLFLMGFLFLFLFSITNFEVLGVTFYVHPLFVFSSMIVIGYQLIFFSIFSKSYQINHLDEPEPKELHTLFSKINLEKGILMSLSLMFFGVIIYSMILIKWIESGFGELNQIKNSLIALTFIVIGIQTLFNSFMLSIIGIRQK